MRRAAVLLALSLTALASGARAASFDPTPWREDYADLKAELQKSYANLAWFASPQGGVDLPALDRQTRRQIDGAENDAQAAQAIRSFVAGLGDGHFSELPRLAPAPAGPAPAARDLKGLDAPTACAAMGYAHRTTVAFSAPFEALPGFTLVADGAPKPFRAGVLPLADGRKLGVVRIPRFRQQEYPELCEAAWSPDRPPSRSDLSDATQALVLKALAERLKALAAAGADTVLVDVGGDGGGNDLGDWMVRLFTDRPVRSAPLLMADAPVAVGYYDEELEALRAARKNDGLTPAATAALDKAIGQFEAAKARAGAGGCDLSWAWTERRPWRQGCDRLIPSGFASGALPDLKPGSLGPRTVEAALYWPTVVAAERGAWIGKVYVLTDNRTASSAEMFTASIRNNHIGRVLGQRTSGDGCGFMTDGPPLKLPHSGLRFRVPNCVRLREDGSDEVAGVTPDLPILPAEGESETARAGRVVAAITADRATP